MIYEYECTKCGKVWDEQRLSTKRDEPLSKPCPHCGGEDTVRRNIVQEIKIDYEGKPVTRRSHPDLQERLKSMKDNFETKFTKTTINCD